MKDKAKKNKRFITQILINKLDLKMPGFQIEM